MLQFIAGNTNYGVGEIIYPLVLWPYFISTKFFVTSHLNSNAPLRWPLSDNVLHEKRAEENRKKIATT